MFLFSLIALGFLIVDASPFLPFPFLNKDALFSKTVQPTSFTSVSMCNDGSFIVAVTPNQVFYWADGYGWIAETGIGLLGQTSVAISNDVKSSFEFTIAGTDGWKYYKGSSFVSGTWTLGTPVYNSASVNTLSMSGAVGTVNQIVGDSQGSIWIATLSSTTFSKFIRTGDVAGTEFLEIAAVASGTSGNNYVMAAYSSSGSDFYKTDQSIAYFSDPPITTYPTGWNSYSAVITDFTISTSRTTWMVSSSKGFSISTNTGSTWSTPINSTYGVQGFASSPDATCIVLLSSNIISASWNSGAQWYDISPDWTPLQYEPIRAAISNNGQVITVITSLNIYLGINCAVAGNSINASCSWSSVSIQTNPATYYKLSNNGLLGIKKSGDVSHLTMDGGATWQVRLSTKNIDTILREAGMYFE